MDTKPLAGIAFLSMILLCIAGCNNKADSTSPDIVYILADDMGYGDVSAINQAAAWPTSHIDRIAEEGFVENK